MSRARDLADAGSKANFLDNVSADINTTYAPKTSPQFTGTITGTGAEGTSASLYLVADEGDDNGDGWRINSNQDVNDLTISNNSSGSYVDKLTLDSSGNLGLAGTFNGTIGTSATINAGTNVSGIGQLVGVSYAGNTAQGTDGNDVTIDLNKSYLIHMFAWFSTYSHCELWRAVGNGSSHTFSELSVDMTGQMSVTQGSGGAGTLKIIIGSSGAYGFGVVFEEGQTYDIA